MLSRVVGFGSALVLVATLVSANFVSAQAPAAKPAGASSGQVFRAKQVIGSQVNIEGDASVGTVDDIVLDDHGNVDYLIVINADNKLVTVPWDAAAFNIEKRIATVRIAPKVYQQIPTYTTEQYPTFAAPTYRTQIYKYYGITPGAERRAVRRGAVITTP
ncbi:MAG: PRC-barrel domain protein [Planctomycetaceae bacterium]|nr:PRC-barrel domain protein [Planctomycetaceae bacterium]